MAARFISTPLNVTENTQISAVFTQDIDTPTTPKDVVTAGENDSLILALIATNGDTAATKLKVLLHDGTTALLLGTVNVPTVSGVDGTAPAVNLLNSVDIPGLEKRDDGGWMLAAGQKFQVATLAAFTGTSAEKITVIAHGGNYAA
jgi:hypothetical protein